MAATKDKARAELEAELEALKLEVKAEYRRGLDAGARNFASTIKTKSARQKRLDEQGADRGAPIPALMASDEATPKRSNLLAPVRPNAGVEIQYQRRLIKLIDEMHASVLYWVKAAYRANEPEVATIDPDDGILAMDEAPAVALQRTMKTLGKRWIKRFDKASDELAAYFAQAAGDRSDAALKAILRKAGIAIKFEMTPAQKDVLSATVEQNVSLIRSIPEQYLTQVQGSVMRAVQSGHKLGQLTEDLQHQFGVAKRRAHFIAADQNAKATAALNRARQLELGIIDAVWVHSGGGKTQRATHVKAGREKTKFDVRKGWFDPTVKQWIQPGELPRCRCVSRSIIKGFI